MKTWDASTAEEHKKWFDPALIPMHPCSKYQWSPKLENRRSMGQNQEFGYYKWAAQMKDRLAEAERVYAEKGLAERKDQRAANDLQIVVKTFQKTFSLSDAERVEALLNVVSVYMDGGREYQFKFSDDSAGHAEAAAWEEAFAAKIDSAW